jgi:hypothetical protein
VQGFSALRYFYLSAGKDGVWGEHVNGKAYVLGIFNAMNYVH